MIIRPAEERGRTAIWSIMEPIIRTGETYALPRDMPEAEALAYWLAPDSETFVAEEGGEVLGTYTLRPNRAVATMSAIAAT